MANDDDLSDLEWERRMAFMQSAYEGKDPNPNELPEPEYVARIEIRFQETRDNDVAWAKFVHGEIQRLIDLRAPAPPSQPVNMPAPPKGEGN